MKTLNIQKNGKPCIYIIKNLINNKFYIGSAIGHYRRKGQHLYMLRNNCHFNKHLQSSWNKYKENNFVFEILEFIDDVNKLQDKEEYWINFYNSTNPNKGYNSRNNCQTNLNLKWSKESRLKFSQSKKGKKIHHLDYTKMNNKPVMAIKKSEIIYFDSIKEAANMMKVDPSVISKAVNKKIKSSKGYIWNFAEKSASNNSVNSGNIHNMDNPDPSTLNDIKVNVKEQRLIGEESTNNPNTSAEHPWISFKEWKLLKKWMMR
jgi:hypothetical protein